MRCKNNALYLLARGADEMLSMPRDSKPYAVLKLAMYILYPLGIPVWIKEHHLVHVRGEANLWNGLIEWRVYMHYKIFIRYFCQWDTFSKIIKATHLISSNIEW
jgi:hypothetical protein